MINEEVINKFMENPVLAHQILGSSLEQFIRFFHWYMYHNEFIFKPFHITIIHKLEDIVFGRNKKKNLMITIPPRWGKLQADDTPVLTREGWKNHGDLVVGDYVIGLDGKFKKVLAVSPRMPANCCVEFTDGDKCYCHENHEWVIDYKPTKQRIIRETKWLQKIKLDTGTPNKRGHKYLCSLPSVSGIEGDVKVLPVQPYSLGVWLGDGSNTEPRITCDKKDQPMIDKMIMDGYCNHNICIHKTTGVYSYYFNNIRKPLNSIGMCFWNKKTEKHIPDIYLTSSEKQRLELLAGLIDTDGSYDSKGRYHFSTTSKQLKDDFISLISTFGWRASVCVTPACTSSSGIVGRKDVYTIGFNVDRIIPCQLDRKKTTRITKKRSIAFKSVTTGDFGKYGKCIEVEDGIYLVGKRLKPTHNSSIMKYFCAWSYLINPASNCIYTSYSDELATSFSKDIREIVESPAFKSFSGIKLNRAKTGADYWATEQGGGLRAAPVAGSITGFGCFSYNTKVKTELGDMKIGDIVSHKTPVKFKSYNWETNEIEYKKPCRFIKNERQEFLRIITNDGAIIDCSTDHNFYTDKGIVRADELTTESVLPSNSIDNVSTYSKFFGNLLARMVFIADKLSLFVSGNVFVNRVLISSNSNPFCFPRPIKSSLNVGYVRRSYSIILFYLLISARVCCNLFCLLYRNLMVSIMRSVSNAILFVAGLRTIRKIFNKIIGRIPIKMSHNHSICPLANKSLCNKSVNSSVFPFSVFRKVCDKISFCCFPKRNHPVHPNASYSANRRNLVQSFIFRDRKPLFIYRIGHFNSFCVTIPHNHNIFLACRQEVLVRNCGVSGDEYGGALIMDDMLKSSNVKSQAEMQNGIDYYLNTLKSRANNQSKTPFVLIMQRLALEDLAGYIQENEKDDWDVVKVQALNEETGEAIWPEKFSAEDLLKLKKLSPFVFYGQYQQEPIVVGGSVYKTEWFRFYNPNEHYDYQMSFITADTAQKKGEGNDFTVFQLWAKTFDNKLHLIDMVRGKFDAQELREQVKLFWRKSQSRTDCVAPYGFYIEDKSSGIGVIQEIKKTDPIPIITIQRARHKDERGQWVSMDKFSRAMTAIPYIANGWVYLPFNEKNDISNSILSEAAAFKADLSHKHDDQIDPMNDAIDIAFGATGLSSIFI